MDLVTHPKMSETASPEGGDARSNEIGSASQIAHAHYQKAVNAYKDGNLTGAIAELEEVLRRDPKHADAEYRLGCYRQELDDLKRDVEELGQAVSDNPNDAKSRFILAESLYSLGRLEEATHQFQQVAEQSDPYLSKRAKKALSRIECPSR